MHRSLLFGIFVFAVFTSIAQTDSLAGLELLEAFDIPRGEVVEFIDETSTGDPVLLSTNDDVIYIRPIDMSTGKPIKILSLRSNQTKKIQSHILRGDSLHCLVKSIINSKHDVYEAVVYTILDGKLAEAHRQELSLERTGDKKNAQEIHFAASDNGKKVLACQQSAYVRGEKAKLKIEVISHPEANVSYNEVNLPFDSDDVEITGVSICDNGMVNIGAKTGTKLNSPFLRKQLLYRFNEETNELYEFDLGVNKTFTQEMLFKTTKDRVEVVSLFSIDPFEQSNISGASYFRIDSMNSNVASRHVINFTEGVASRFELDGKQTGTSIENLFIVDVFNIEEDPVLVLEQRYLDQVCTTDPRTGIVSCTDQFHFDGILVQNMVNQEKWTLIDRRQIDYKGGSEFTSQQCFAMNNGIAVFYNDHIKNESSDSDRIMNNPSRSALRFVHTTSKGIERDLLFAREGDYRLNVSIAGYTNATHTSILMTDGKNYKIGILDTNKMH